MTRALTAFAALLMTLLAASAAAHDADGRATCELHYANVCAPYGCVPADLNANPDLAPQNTGFCGKCTPGHDEQCGGAKCNADGTCSFWAAAPPPPTIWPHFSLLVGDASIAMTNGQDVQPIVGVGYLLQGAFTSVNPVKLVRGPYVAQNLPWLYWNLGASAAFGGASQNLFVDAGLTAYYPGFPLAITTISVGALYQRTGTAIWKQRTQDRVGPDLTFGFLQNLFVRVAWLPLHAHGDDAAFVVSLLYMRDLVDDLVPDRFQKYLPEAFR
jgi:hypothetical protein